MTSNFVARQQTPTCYDMNASTYAYRRNYLIHGTMHERMAQIWEMADTGILDIDCDEDFELREVIFRFMMERRPEYKEQFGMFLDK